jgi:hypothetical protein
LVKATLDCSMEALNFRPTPAAATPAAPSAALPRAANPISVPRWPCALLAKLPRSLLDSRLALPMPDSEREAAPAEAWKACWPVILSRTRMSEEAISGAPA